MTQTWQSDTGIPVFIQQGLEAIIQAFEKVLDKQMQSLVLYGDLARGRYSPEYFNTSLMLVMDQVTIDTLDRLQPLVHKAMQTIRLTLLLITEEELRYSTDVFPIKFLDIKKHHYLLYGRDLMADIDISCEHIRLRCEQEMKNLLYRLRRFYLMRSQTPEMMATTMESMVAPFLTSVETLWELVTNQTAPTIEETLIEAVVDQFQLELSPLMDLLALKAGNYKPVTDSLKILYGDFMKTLEILSRVADQLSPYP